MNEMKNRLAHLGLLSAALVLMAACLGEASDRSFRLCGDQLRDRLDLVCEGKFNGKRASFDQAIGKC